MDVKIMNKDKSIKDLKKRNDSLKMQYEYRNIRCITLENRIESYEQQITQLTNNWNELEEYIIEQETINNGAMKCSLSSDSEIKQMEIENDIYDLILDKMKEIKEGVEDK